MALGFAVAGQRFENPRELLGDPLAGVYRLLAEHGDRVFGDDYFADLYLTSRKGRPTIPARVLATAMVLQAFEGLSDQEAVDRLGCDLRWQAAAGVDAGYVPFHSTVLVGQRNRLRASARPKRFLEDTKVVAREAGVFGDRVRVLDSTPIYDAVSTQDTVTQLRASIRKVLAALAGTELAVKARSVLCRDDDYAGPGVNGHWFVPVGGRGFSPRMAMGIPRGRSCFPRGMCGGLVEGLDSFAGCGLGEADAVAAGDDDVGVV
jgi:hypothetical protein